MTPVCAALALALSAEPAPALIELQYSAPSGCPSREAVIAEVARLRGPVRSASVNAEARLEASNGRWVAQVTTHGESGAGERVLDADTCDQLAQEVEVVLTLALADPRAPPGPAVTAPVVVPPPAPESAPLNFELEAGGGARVGLLSDVMPLALVGGAVERSWLRVGLELALSGSTLVTGPTAAARVDSWLQPQLSLCAAPLRGGFRLDACLAVDTVLLSASGQNVAVPASNTTLWVATELRLRASVQLWRGLRAFAGVSGGIALVRPRFFVDLGSGTETVYQSPLLSAQGIAGLAWSW